LFAINAGSLESEGRVGDDDDDDDVLMIVDIILVVLSWMVPSTKLGAKALY
jgi:hypothetical protein